MLTYVNRNAVDDLLAPVEAEHDPVARIDMARIIVNDFHRLITEQYERTAYELKRHRQWNTGQIAELMGISERHVKRMLRDYSKRTGIHNPLQRFQQGDYQDISELVKVRKGNGPSEGSSQSPS